MDIKHDREHTAWGRDEYNASTWSNIDVVFLGFGWRRVVTGEHKAHGECRPCNADCAIVWVHERYVWNEASVRKPKLEESVRKVASRKVREEHD